MSLVLNAIRGSLLLKSKAMARAHRIGLMRSGSVVGSLWTPLLIRPRLWRSLPLFPVKKFNGQEMDGRTLKVEIAKSGAPFGMKAIQRSQNLALSSWCFGPDDRPGGWNVHAAL